MIARRLAWLVAIAGAVGCGTILAPPFDDAADGGSSSSADAAGSPDGAPGGPDGGEDAGVDAARPARPRVVFVTRGTLNGGFGGPDAGDSLCNAEAADAGIGGSFVAWLSVATGSSIDAIERLNDVDGGWSLVGGGNVFPSKKAIADGTPPARGIGQTAYGDGAFGRAWTASGATGEHESADCVGWTDGTLNQAGVEGILGAMDVTWTKAASNYCSNANHLICFEK